MPLTPDTLRDLFGAQLEALAGGAVSGEIPLTDAVVNRVIAQQLAGRQLPITAAEAEAHDGDTFAVHVRPRAFLKELRLEVRIVRQPQLPGDPTLTLQWGVRGFGPLALLAGPIASHFKALPPGIRLDGDRLLLDVHTLLRSRGLGDVVPLLTGLRVGTREGRFVIAFELRR